MQLAISAFLVISALIYGLGVILMRGSRNHGLEVLVGKQRRPLIFGPLTVPLAGVIPCPASTKAGLAKELRRAGYYHRYAYAEFTSLRNVLTVGWVLLVVTLVVLFTRPGEPLVWKLAAAGVAGAGLLYGLPRLLLHSWAKARIRRIHEALPDALDMTAMCAGGGIALHQAFYRVGEELDPTHPDLACELRILARQSEASSFDVAIAQFAARLDTSESHSLNAIVGQNHRQGCSVVYAFQEFSDSIRRERRQRAEDVGNKSTVKMLFPLVFCLAPPIYMLLLTPAVVELRSFVLQENRPGGILAPSGELLTAAAASPTAVRRAVGGPVERRFGQGGIPQYLATDADSRAPSGTSWLMRSNGGQGQQ